MQFTKRHSYWCDSTTKDTTKTRRVKKDIFFLLGKVRRMMFKSLDGLYVHIRGLKRNHCWSSRFGSSHIALRMLLCTVWVCAQDSLWDPGRRGFCCLHCRKVSDSYSTLKRRPENKCRLCWSYIANTQTSRKNLMAAHVCRWEWAY